MSNPEIADSTTVGQLLDELAGVLRGGGVPHAFSEARDLVSSLYDVPRFWPMINGSVAVDPALHERARRAARARTRGAPLAYAVGRASFRRLTLDVDERVLIPRPETEHLVELVLEETSGMTGGVVVDVGTGSGAIAISLAMEGNARFSRVYGTDISLDAVNVARGNAARLGAPVSVIHGSLLAPLRGLTAHVVVSNPPYIALGEAESLPSSVRDWEPAPALYSGADGMRATAGLVQQAADVLAPGGLLAIEVDVRRASLAAELVSREQRFHSIRVELDLTGRERFVLARRLEGEGE
ncbi:MAG: peptide chain release factor N(5)-glutamine methyltransferase [Gemmatimonadaceae bacterium]